MLVFSLISIFFYSLDKDTTLNKYVEYNTNREMSKCDLKHFNEVSSH